MRVEPDASERLDDGPRHPLDGRFPIAPGGGTRGKHRAPIPRAVERSSSFRRPAAARGHLVSSALAVLSTYAAWAITCPGAMLASASAARNRVTRSGRIESCRRSTWGWR